MSGILHEWMGAVATHERIILLVRLSTKFIMCYFFTLDRQDIVSAIVEARGRGVHVEVGVDRGWCLDDRCRDQYVSVRELETAGTKVRLLTGVSRRDEYLAVNRTPPGGQGYQHAKCVHCDAGTVMGSTNMTTSTRANNELSAHFTMRPQASRTLRMEMAMKISEGEEIMPAEFQLNQKRYGGRRSRSESGRTRSQRAPAPANPQELELDCLIPGTGPL